MKGQIPRPVSSFLGRGRDFFGEIGAGGNF